MLARLRPPEPADFAKSAERARQKIDAIIDAGDAPSAKDFDSKIWKAHKGEFAEVQNGKCGYCDHDTHVGYVGDVEHYAPKSRVERIVADAAPATRGQQTPAHPIEMTHAQGYYWRAYDWTNYLYACAICNSRHKRCLFPLAHESDANDPGVPHPDRACDPLLLNPYEAGFEPRDHLDFDEFGCISDAHSVRGWETIRTCRLDRIELQEARLEKARAVSHYLNWLDHGVDEDDIWKIRRALAEIVQLGEVSRPFAGMVRIMAARRLGHDWEALEALLEALCVKLEEAEPSLE